MLLRNKWRSSMLLKNFENQFHHVQIGSTANKLWRLRAVTASAGLSTSSVRAFPAVPELTSVRYPNLVRGAFSELTDADRDVFRGILPDPGQVLTADEGLDAYNTDWLYKYRGKSQLVLRPRSTTQVSAILKYCSSRRLAVVPQGGNTGLVGGSVPVFDEIILSMELLNKVLSFDSVAGILLCEAGCILEKLDEELAKEGFMMPLDLGSKGSCHIGGNVSTNAGGIRLLRYGSMHGSVLGLEAVLANGEIINCMTGCRKDNTGYHLRHLFIGSEGTLGVVTAVSVLCPQKPSAVNVALLACESFEAVQSILCSARQHLNEILSAFEFLDSDTMEVTTRHLRTSCPLVAAKFYVLIETSGSNSVHDEQKLQSFVDDVMTSKLVTDGTIANDSAKIKALWKLRETAAVGLLDDGYVYKYDVSVPLKDFYQVVEIMRPRLADSTTRVCGYGHVGDGNIHFNAISKEYDPEVVKKIEPFLYEFVSSRHGSISAEHGLGICKNQYIGYSQSATSINLMTQIKTALDPVGILNPYKTLPSQG